MSVTISGSGQIIKQIVQTSYTSSTVSISAASPSSWATITGAAVTITPTNANNKVLISYTVEMGVNANGNYATFIRILRNGTPIAVGDARGSTTQATTQSLCSHSGYTAIHNFSFLDSPATTSAVTYQLQGSSESGVVTQIGGSYGTSASYTGSVPTVITAQEVAYA